MAIDESGSKTLDWGRAPRVSLSKRGNERFPTLQELLTANGQPRPARTASRESESCTCRAVEPCVSSIRFIRLRDAPSYLGMDKNRFTREVRPHVIVIPIGTQGVAFDRLDLDAWADDHKRRNGRPAAQSERRKSWDCKNRPASPCVARPGTSTKTSTERAFAKALARAISGKR
jgi:hypothetical protein